MPRRKECGWVGVAHYVRHAGSAKCTVLLMLFPVPRCSQKHIKQQASRSNCIRTACDKTQACVSSGRHRFRLSSHSSVTQSPAKKRLGQEAGAAAGRMAGQLLRRAASAARHRCSSSGALFLLRALVDAVRRPPARRQGSVGGGAGKQETPTPCAGAALARQAERWQAGQHACTQQVPCYGAAGPRLTSR